MLILRTQEERADDDRVQMLGESSVGLLEPQASGFVIIKPYPAPARAVIIHAPKLLEALQYGGPVRYPVVQAHGLKVLTCERKQERSFFHAQVPSGFRHSSQRTVIIVIRTFPGND